MIYVVTEEQLDADLLRQALPHEIVKHVTFRIGGGRYGAQTLAASLIAKQQQPTALVINTASEDPDVIEEKLQFSTALVRRVAGEISFGVFAAVPSVEGALSQKQRFFGDLIEFLTSVMQQSA
jgi:hypothetical protein